MTPKDKAIELVNKFSKVGLQQRDEGVECALIAVDEIIDAIDWHKLEYPNELVDYLSEVKKEIQKF